MFLVDVVVVVSVTDFLPCVAERFVSEYERERKKCVFLCRKLISEWIM